MAIASYLAGEGRDHRVNAALKGLARPSLGEWLGFLRECDQCVGAVLDTRNASIENLLYVNPQQLVSEAIELMRSTGVSQLPVCKNTPPFAAAEVSGSIDELELMEAIHRDPGVMATPVEKVMGPKLPTVGVGQKVELIPSHSCTTCNLYRQLHVHEQGRIVSDRREPDGVAEQRSPSELVAGVLAGGRKDLHAQARSQRLLAARLGLGRRSGDREQGKTEDDGDGAHDVVTPWRTRRPRGRRTAEF